jgi:hypothetical protein
MLIVTLVCVATLRARALWVPLLVGSAALVVMVAVLQYHSVRLAEPRYAANKKTAFAAWRAAIPTSAEVLWFEDPAASWTMLERKSYISITQSAGLVYSPAATLEFVRRSQALSALADPAYWLEANPSGRHWPRALTAPGLREICRDRSLSFVVSPAALDGYVLKGEWPDRGFDVYLYDCRRYRRDATA